MVKIKEGYYYRSKNDAVFGPMQRNVNNTFGCGDWIGSNHNCDTYTWDSQGKRLQFKLSFFEYLFLIYTDPYDLVEEVPPPSKWNRPNIKYLPDWVKYVAQDRSGVWKGFRDRPSDNFEGCKWYTFCVDISQEMMVISYDKPNPHWETTLSKIDRSGRQTSYV